MIKAYQATPAATVTPFSYTMLLWATLFGFVLFADLPDAWTVAGALVIVLSGLYIFRRELLRPAGQLFVNAGLGEGGLRNRSLFGTDFSGATSAMQSSTHGLPNAA